MSVSDIEEEMKEIYGIKLSTSSIYNAPTKEAATMELKQFELKWKSKYPYAIRSWRNNWDNLNGKIRKYTKTKLSFPSDYALRKSVHLAIAEIEKKWYSPI